LAINLESVDLMREPAGGDTYWAEELDGTQICQFLNYLVTCDKRRKIRKSYSEINKMNFWGVQKDGSRKRYYIWNLLGNIVKFDGKTYDIPANLNIS